MTGAQVIRRVVQQVFLFALIGCSEADNGTGIGPCVHNYEEPILHVQSVTNAQTGAQIEAIILSDVRIDSTKTDLRFLIIESNRIAMLDSSLVGNPPCSFGIQEGKYSFSVSASGYRDTLIIADAAYSIFEGGCPSRSGFTVDSEEALRKPKPS